MRALWSGRQTCSHDVTQKFKRIKRFSDMMKRGVVALSYQHKISPPQPRRVVEDTVPSAWVPHAILSGTPAPPNNKQGPDGKSGDHRRVAPCFRSFEKGALRGALGRSVADRAPNWRKMLQTPPFSNAPFWAIPPIRLGLSGRNSREIRKDLETLSERFLEFPSRL